DVDIRMGTFWKSLASCGGFIAGPADVVDFLRVQSRSFMFTAAAVPAAIGAAQGALRIVPPAGGAQAVANVVDNRATLARVGGDHADRAGAGRGRLEGRDALEGPLRRRRVRERGDLPRRPAWRR